MATVRAAHPRPGHQLPRPRRILGRGFGVLAAAAFVAQGLLVAVPVALPLTAATAAAAAPTLPPGFVDETVVTGLTNPTVITYAPGGRVFVAEKRGIVKTWSSVASFDANAAPTTTLDIRGDVMNYWDRGLLGLAVDPNWPASNFIYVLYTYNAIPGGSVPAWSNGDPNSDPCGSPPGSTTDGCVVQNRLERVTVNTTSGISTARTPLLTGWCQQFPSHSAGTVTFGPDGMLYVSAGDGASFNLGAQDYGQKGGTLPDTTNPVTPVNPCGDPPGGKGGAMSAPTAEGGALRAQSFRRAAGESAVLNGAVLRLNPATGAAGGRQPGDRQQRPDPPADRRLRAPEPVPDHVPPGHVGPLHRRRRLLDLGGGQSAAEPDRGRRAGELRLAVPRGTPDRHLLHERHDEPVLEPGHGHGSALRLRPDRPHGDQ